MAHLYIDHDVSPYLVPLLEHDDHTAVAAHDIGLAAAADEIQLLTAVQNDAIFVTCNRRDFEVLHRAWTHWSEAFDSALPPHRGILCVAQTDLADQAAALSHLLRTVSDEMVHNRIWWWAADGNWHEWVDGNWIPFVL